MKLEKIFFIAITILILGGCSISNNQNHQSLSAYSQLLDSDKLKVDYTIYLEHSRYDVCYNHNTSACPKFFEKTKKLGLATDREMVSINKEDTNNSARPHNSNYSNRALETRKNILNRYFDLKKEEYSMDSEMLSKMDCGNTKCRIPKRIQK